MSMSLFKCNLCSVFSSWYKVQSLWSFLDHTMHNQSLLSALILAKGHRIKHWCCDICCFNWNICLFALTVIGQWWQLTTTALSERASFTTSHCKDSWQKTWRQLFKQARARRGDWWYPFAKRRRSWFHVTWHYYFMLYSLASYQNVWSSIIVGYLFFFHYLLCFLFA